jgi:hypothetical protein
MAGNKIPAAHKAAIARTRIRNCFLFSETMRTSRLVGL